MSCSHSAAQFCGQRCRWQAACYSQGAGWEQAWWFHCRFLAALGPASCNLEVTVSTRTIFGSKKPVFSWQRLKSAVDPSILVSSFDIMANENDDGVGMYLCVSQRRCWWAVGLIEHFLPVSLRNPWFLILRGWGMSLCFLEVGRLEFTQDVEGEHVWVFIHNGSLRGVKECCWVFSAGALEVHAHSDRSTGIQPAEVGRPGFLLKAGSPSYFLD